MSPRADPPILAMMVGQVTIWAAIFVAAISTTPAFVSGSGPSIRSPSAKTAPLARSFGRSEHDGRFDRRSGGYVESSTS